MATTPLDVLWKLATVALVMPVAFSRSSPARDGPALTLATAPTAGCALGGPFYQAVAETAGSCLAKCTASSECGGFSYKDAAGTGEPAKGGGHGNCTGQSPGTLKVKHVHAVMLCTSRPPTRGNT